MASLLSTFLKAERSGAVLTPILQDFLVAQAKKEETDPMAHIKAVRYDAKLTIACFKARIEEFNHTDPATKEYFHPSQIGQCLRKMWFEHFKAPSNGLATRQEIARSHFTFELGTYFHVLFQNLCKRAGVLEKREFPVQDDKLRIIGHADGVLKLPMGRVVLEIKTIGSRGYSMLSDGPKPEHLQQANIYMKVLGIHYTVFIYFNKDTSETKEFLVPASPKLFKASYVRIETLRNCIKGRIAPDREGSSPHKFPCSYCEFSKVCYGSEHFDKFVKSIAKKK